MAKPKQKGTIRERKPQDFDISSFISAQDIEMDPEVADLLESKKLANLNESIVDVKKSKKQKDTHKNEQVQDAQEEEEMNSEDERELQAYLQMNSEMEEKVYKNEKVALLERLKDIQLQVPFIEQLSSTFQLEKVDFNDDLNRELGFYNQALKSVEYSKKELQKLKIPFTRPDDYFAEMVKPDSQMLKIKQNLLNEKESLEKSIQAKKQRELKKFGKKVQTEKLLQRQEQKKQTIEKIKKIKKNNLDFDVEIDKEKPNKKREGKNKKYGFQKKEKRNSAKSTDDISGFSIKKMKAGVSKKRK
ncbi:rRNA-processing protein and EBNA1-binding protein ebp2 [Boothiomyces sp. JEL0866]|nr:rRNA-processing protein and EBNA1-binding protein ebp2 [Boothiomyces sp. JEL0866]